MKVSGFTFIRNAVQYDFPIVEAVTSVLPIVDEFIVNVGQSDDATLERVRSIGSRKNWSIDPWMYRKATRIVRNHCGVRSATDGCDFLPQGKRQMLKSGPHGRLIKARMFHYGWVKDSNVLQRKLEYQISRHEGERTSMRDVSLEAPLRSEYPTYDVLKDYRGTHPQVMTSRIASKARLRPRRNRWLNPRFYQEILSHGFKG